jgi:uncharacterized LabA/DUF88 family protein
MHKLQITQINPNYCFIDGQNIETELLKSSQRIDWKLLFEYLQTRHKCSRIIVFLKNSKYRNNFYNSLKKIGYEVELSDFSGKKVNIDGDLIVSSLVEYFQDQKYNLFLFSGDGDFAPLLRFFESSGMYTKVFACSTSISGNIIKDKKSFLDRSVTFIDTRLSQLLIQK